MQIKIDNQPTDWPARLLCPHTLCTCVFHLWLVLCFPIAQIIVSNAAACDECHTILEKSNAACFGDALRLIIAEKSADAPPTMHP